MFYILNYNNIYLISYFNKVVIPEYYLKKIKTKISVLPSEKITSIPETVELIASETAY